MRRHTCCGNDGAESVFPCGFAELLRLGGGAVRRKNMYLMGYAECGQGIRRFFDDRKIAVTAHYDGNFFHGKNLQNSKGHTYPTKDKSAQTVGVKLFFDPCGMLHLSVSHKEHLYHGVIIA